MTTASCRPPTAANAARYGPLTRTGTRSQNFSTWPSAKAGYPRTITTAAWLGLAIASLACGLAQFMFGPLATIPAIVFGHLARHQIKRTGEQGAGLALAGLILGWAAVVLAVLLILGVAAAAGMHGMMR